MSSACSATAGSAAFTPSSSPELPQPKRKFFVVVPHPANEHPGFNHQVRIDDDKVRSDASEVEGNLRPCTDPVRLRSGFCRRTVFPGAHFDQGGDQDGPNQTGSDRRIPRQGLEQHAWAAAEPRRHRGTGPPGLPVAFNVGWLVPLQWPRFRQFHSGQYARHPERDLQRPADGSRG